MKHKAVHPSGQSGIQNHQVLPPQGPPPPAQVEDYYRALAPWLLPKLQGRPLQPYGWPQSPAPQLPLDGAGPWPQALRRVEIRDQQGLRELPAVDDGAGLDWIAAEGGVELYGWLSRAPSLDRPDQLVFDLEPEDRPFDQVKTAAALLADLLEDLGLKAYPLLTGDTGLQLRVPLDGTADFPSTRALARRVARAAMIEDPERYSAESSPARREARLFINYLLNAQGSLAIVPGSLRARPGTPAAAPVTWDELGDPDLGPRSYRRARLLERLAQQGDPWAGFSEEGYSVAAAHDRLDRSASTV